MNKLSHDMIEEEEAEEEEVYFVNKGLLALEHYKYKNSNSNGDSIYRNNCHKHIYHQSAIIIDDKCNIYNIYGYVACTSK